MSSHKGGSKRSRNVVGSSAAQRQAPSHVVCFKNTKFLGPEKMVMTTSLIGIRIWDEKFFALNPQGTYRDIAKNLNDRRWEILMTPPTMINYDIMRGFIQISCLWKVWVLTSQPL